MDTNDNLQRLPSSGRRRRKAENASPSRKRPAGQRSAARSESTSSERPVRKSQGKKRPRTPVEVDESSRDPLGGLIRMYGTSLMVVILILVFFWVLGGAVFVGVLFTEGTIATVLKWVGVFFLVCGLLAAGVQAINLNRRLELRKNGIRYINGGIQKEFPWEEIVEVEVERLDTTDLGPVSLQRRSNDASRPTNVLRRSHWKITIHSRSGDTITLGDVFTNIIPKPQELISELRLRSGPM
ncbi:MAG: hypothetical protein CMJ46_15115 [Planctomyces sp.]|nr:hypothetical protein [Planctomyces sp.]